MELKRISYIIMMIFRWSIGPTTKSAYEQEFDSAITAKLLCNKLSLSKHKNKKHISMIKTRVLIV